MTVTLTDRFRQVRGATERLAEPLEVEDTVVQTMPDVSPTKWHLAHVTWFFEAFVLGQYGDERCQAPFVRFATRQSLLTLKWENRISTR